MVAYVFSRFFIGYLLQIILRLAPFLIKFPLAEIRFTCFRAQDGSLISEFNNLACHLSPRVSKTISSKINMLKLLVPVVYFTKSIITTIEGLCNNNMIGNSILRQNG